MINILASLLTLLFFLGGPAMEANADFGRSSLAAEGTSKINNLADDILDWVGPKSTLEKPPGGSDLILRSADGIKQIRFDLTNPHGLQPHVNIETFKPRNLFPGDRKMINTEDNHIFPKP